MLINSIKILNVTNGDSINIMGMDDYKTLYSYTTPYDQINIGNENGDYLLVGYSGFHSLPNTVNTTSATIRTDGSKWVKTQHSTRILAISCNFNSCYDFTMINSVLYSRNALLKVIAYTSNGEFMIDGFVTDSFEEGVISIECPDPMFTTPDLITETGTLNMANTSFFPFDVSSVYFGESGKYELDVFSPLGGDITLRLSGGWDGVSISNKTTATTLDINSVCNNSCFISTADKTVEVDSYDTVSYNGIFPKLTNGTNIISIQFDSQSDDVEYEITRRSKYANVF